MKVAHSNKGEVNLEDSFATAQQHELDGKLELAVAVYLSLIKKYPREEKIYNRLMILYRKLKDTKKEIDIINKGIEVFTALYEKKHKAPPRKVSQLSSALMKATGLTDKKGKSLYAPEPLAKWERRKSLLEKRHRKK